MLKVVVKIAFLLVFFACHNSLEINVNAVKLTSKYKKHEEIETVEDNIHVHVIAHTHDDIGWLETIDEYYINEVQFILSSVVQSLIANPQRKFMYAEVGFFVRWWMQQSDVVKQQTRYLIKNGQLSFVAGGYCQNDEASVHYNSVIDQMTLGHRFLLEEFDYKPRIAWQIDPFGHSNTMASLFASMGFDALYFARIDHADVEKRKKNRELEWLWRGSSSLGKENEIFTGMLQNHYGWPAGLNLEADNFPNLNDDPRLLLENNMKKYVDLFVENANAYASYHKHRHVFFPMGEDFTYQNGDKIFSNLDKLLNAVNKDGRVKAFYSNVDMYTDAVHSENVTFNTKSDDLFPYSDGPHAYWTGYFTSRPAFKKMERDSMAYLQTCRLFESIIATTESNESNKFKQSDILAEAMGIAQHHDAVSGTEKQHVVEDYAIRLDIGSRACDKVTQTFFSHYGDNQFSQCRMLNSSLCDITETAEHSFMLVAMNPLSFKTQQTVRLPINYDNVIVKEASGNVIKSVVRPAQESSRLWSSAKNEVEFSMEVDSLVTAVYYIEKSDIEEENDYSTTIEETDSKLIIDNGITRVGVNKKDGMITFIKTGNHYVAAQQDFGFYESSTGTFSDRQKSGAYIFRPKDQKAKSVVSNSKVESVNGEIRVKINDWISQVIRLNAGESEVELDMTIGSIPDEDGVGKEVIIKFNTDIESSKVFYTDSNGREMQKRVIDHRDTWDLENFEPVSQNYYPINTRAFIKDETSDSSEVRYFSLISDRTIGGASLTEGHLETMLHRRLFEDDARGVGEPLNEPDQYAKGRGLVIRSKMFVGVSGNSMTSRKKAHVVTYPLQLFFSNHGVESNSLPQTFAKHFNNIDYALPENVHLLTFEYMENLKKTYLLRFDHIYESGEGELSKPVTVDVQSLFGFFGKITSLEEHSLSANQLKKDVKRLIWKSNDAETKENAYLQNSPMITLKAQEIRTFIISFS